MIRFKASRCLTANSLTTLSRTSLALTFRKIKEEVTKIKGFAEERRAHPLFTKEGRTKNGT